MGGEGTVPEEQRNAVVKSHHFSRWRVSAEESEQGGGQPAGSGASEGNRQGNGTGQGNGASGRATRQPSNGRQMKHRCVDTGRLAN